MAARSLARRVDRLERGPDGKRGSWRLCAGVGKLALVDDRDGETPADARGCASCGKISKLVVLEG
jgi:hypothetical protein